MRDFCYDCVYIRPCGGDYTCDCDCHLFGKPRSERIQTIEDCIEMLRSHGDHSGELILEMMKSDGKNPQNSERPR